MQGTGGVGAVARLSTPGSTSFPENVGRMRMRKEVASTVGSFSLVLRSLGTRSRQSVFFSESIAFGNALEYEIL